MAVDMFMKIEGVKGESKDDKYKDTIDVLSWNWGASNSGTFHTGGGGGAGKANIQDLSFTKFIDKSSPELLLACANGKHFPKSELIVRKAGEKPVDYLKITMENVLVTSLSTGGSGGEDRLTENVTINFAKFGVEYTEQDEKGKGGSPQKMGWDVTANKKR